MTTKPTCFGERKWRPDCDVCHWWNACELRATYRADFDEPELCSTCNGTGQGQTDGTWCHQCKGRGTA